ncbi:MAG: hypothetical protein NUV50_01645 [Rhodospirillales bacterium]|nr:hypothetical protein [Rhodospirillales bacterium]
MKVLAREVKVLTTKYWQKTPPYTTALTPVILKAEDAARWGQALGKVKE